MIFPMGMLRHLHEVLTAMQDTVDILGLYLRQHRFLQIEQQYKPAERLHSYPLSSAVAIPLLPTDEESAQGFRDVAGQTSPM